MAPKYENAGRQCCCRMLCGAGFSGNRLMLQNAPGDRQAYRPEHFEALTDYQKNLHHKAFDSNTADPHSHTLEPLTYDDNGTKRSLKIPKGDVLYNFRQDVMSGKLPTVS